MGGEKSPKYKIGQKVIVLSKDSTLYDKGDKGRIVDVAAPSNSETNDKYWVLAELNTKKHGIVREPFLIGGKYKDNIKVV